MNREDVLAGHDSAGHDGGGAYLRVSVANWEHGGLDLRDGSDARWRQTVAVLAGWQPHVVLAQEIPVPWTKIGADHLARTEQALGMQAVTGPPTPMSGTGNCPAVFVSPGLPVTGRGPSVPLAGGHPAWCQVSVQVPGGPVLGLYSVHMPSRAAGEQVVQAQWLASVAAERRRKLGEATLAGGDWNSYHPGDGLTSVQLDRMPEHVRTARVIPGPDGTLYVHPGVHDVLAMTGLADLAAELRPEMRDPADLTATSPSGGRVLRCYGSLALAGAAVWYEQKPIGSDHHALLVVLDTRRLALTLAS